MWLRLAAASVLWACGGPPSAAVENRGGTASPRCDLPTRLEFEARRYGNLDADQPDYHTWSPWRVGIQLARADDPDAPRAGRGTITMIGDELQWTFEITTRLDRDRCTLELWTDTHEPMRAELDVRARTGTIRSIDDVWQLGPPFPAHRP